MGNLFEGFVGYLLALGITAVCGFLIFFLLGIFLFFPFRDGTPFGILIFVFTVSCLLVMPIFRFFSGAFRDEILGWGKMFLLTISAILGFVTIASIAANTGLTETQSIIFYFLMAVFGGFALIKTIDQLVEAGIIPKNKNTTPAGWEDYQ